MRSTDAAVAVAERVFPAMASTVTMRLLDPDDHAEDALQQAESLIQTIARTCTRFNPDSDVMRANAAGRRWAQVDPVCLDVIARAYDAYSFSGGRFDPRTLDSLVALGYDRTWEEVASGDVASSDVASAVHRRAGRVKTWRPRIDVEHSRVRVGSRPIDLGGIGKGVAVQRALEVMRGHGSGGLVEAGGDLAVFGPGPQGPRWRVSVDDPFGGADPVAVLDVTDTAVATSSIQRRQWNVDGERVHHLIDPRTGQPAESGLHAVSVVHPDAAIAEVWTKIGFLAGRHGIRRVLEEAALPAVWVDDDGRVRYSRAAAPLLIWKVSRV